jgi:hypothetical protein
LPPALESPFSSHKKQGKKMTSGRVRYPTLIVFCLLMTGSAGQGYECDKAAGCPPRRNAAGLAAGVPQTIALTYERIVGSRLAARFHLGSAVLLSSVGLCVQWGYTSTGLHPYLFAGPALIYAIAEDYGDPEGTAVYAWFGPGVLLRKERWIFYSEVGALLGGDRDSGLGDDWVFPFSPVIAAGAMIRF